jgi:shikimate dehydrogenase
MSSPQVLQPLVCCMGDPVAGNPTQFVMSRVSRDTGVDWRFFTSHVLDADFDAAIRGVQALGLQGIAILEPYQQRVIPYLDTVTESGLLLGRVTVGRSEGSSWLGDNLVGQAIVQSLHDAMGNSSGETRRIVVVGSEPLAKCLRLHSTNLGYEWVSIAHGPQVNWPDGFELGSGSLHGVISLETISRGMSKQLSNLGWDAKARFLKVPTPHVSDWGDWKKESQSLGIQGVDPVEVLAHESASNFHFWTGITPSLEAIRDSIEEYLAI